MFKLFIFVILYCFAHMVIHELCHVLIALVLKLEVKKIQFGLKELNVIDTRKIAVSPVLLGGYVEVDRFRLIKLSCLKMFLFFESGSVGNLLVMLLFLLFTSGIYSLICWVSGILLFFSNQMPIGRSDLAVFFKLCKEKKQY